jgi:hypothetical protein
MAPRSRQRINQQISVACCPALLMIHKRVLPEVNRSMPHSARRGLRVRTPTPLEYLICSRRAPWPLTPRSRLLATSVLLRFSATDRLLRTRCCAATPSALVHGMTIEAESRAAPEGTSGRLRIGEANTKIKYGSYFVSNQSRSPTSYAADIYMDEIGCSVIAHAAALHGEGGITHL